METLLSYFKRVEDGKWRCVKSNDFMGPTGRVQINAGTEFAIGSNYMGVDIGRELENAERDERNAARDRALVKDYEASKFNNSPGSSSADLGKIA